MQIELKLRDLHERLTALEGAIVAFSGGADSSFLMEVAHRALGRRALAAIADSPSLPRRELSGALELATSRGWEIEIVKTLELTDDRYASNPLDRCYFCKTSLMEALEPVRRARGSRVLLGTNTDDLADWRPGQKAASEHGAMHPLVDSGFSKSEVREASRQLDLPTFDKPAAACLSSRFAYGVRIDAESLARVEQAEDALYARGFSIVRVRDLGESRARVEVGANEVDRLMQQQSGILDELLRCGFEDVQIDPRGYRSGSMNEGVVVGISKR